MFSINRSLLYQLLGFFKKNFIKLVAVIVYARLKRKVGCLRKLSQFNLTDISVLCTETVKSFFHLYGCGHHHNRIDDVSLAAGTLEEDDDLVALYL
jgi:hypothetical protein